MDSKCTSPIRDTLGIKISESQAIPFWPSKPRYRITIIPSPFNYESEGVILNYIKDFWEKERLFSPSEIGLTSTLYVTCIGFQV